ncbi:MAG: hypothetical protein ACTSVW_05085 [Candidatus Njordarchaeales archaeon]
MEVNLLREVIKVVNKIDYKSTKFSIFIGVIISTLFFVIASRVMLLSPGLIQQVDSSTFSYYNSINLAKYLYTWNPYLSSDNFPYLNQFICRFWLLIEDTEIAIRLIFLTVFVLMGSIIFSTVFVWTKERYKNILHCYITSTTALSIYMANIWVTNTINNPHFLWSYAFTPLIFFLTSKAINQTSRNYFLKYSLILALALFFTTASYVGIVTNFLLFIYCVISEVLFNIIKYKRGSINHIAKGATLVLFTVTLSLLLFAYYFLPYYIHYRELLSSEAIMYYMGQVKLIESALARLRTRTILKAILGQLALIRRIPVYAFPDVLRRFGILLTMLIPLFAFMSLILRPKDKDVLRLCILATILIYLAKGPNEPFGNIFIWLSLLLEKPLGGTTILKWIRSGMPLLWFSYAFLSSITLIEFLDKLSKCKWLESGFSEKSTKGSFYKKITGILVVILLLISIFFTNPIFLSGDLEGSLTPFNPPSEYYELNYYLRNQEGDFRVSWLPPSSEYIWKPFEGKKLRLPSAWLSTRPNLVCTGALAVFVGKEPEWKMFEYYVYRLLLKNQTQNIGKLFGLENVKYVIYHNDTFDYKMYLEILKNLQIQDDLTLAFSNDYLYAFENHHSSPYVYTSNKAILVIGGLDVLSLLCDLDGYIPYNYPLIFIEQYALDKTDLETYLKFADAILFYGEKDLNDLFLSTIDREFLYSPADFRPAFSPWKVDFFFSSKWIKRSFLQAEGLKYDFDLNMKIIFSNSNNQTFNLPIKASSEGTYEIWARVLQTPKSGNITFTIDNLWRSEISAKSYKQIKGFKWIKVLETFLEEGEHTLTITNNFGINAINVIAVVPKSELEHHKNDVLILIKSSSSRILYLKDLYIMDRWPASGMYISKVSNFYIPKKQNYIIAIQTYVTEIPSSVKITIDDISYSLRLTEGENCNYIGPISLEKGNHKIIIQSKKAGVKFGMILIYSTNREDGKPEAINDIFQGESANCIINYEKVNPALVKVSVNATKPFILSFAESLDPLWIAYADDGTNFPKVTINSVLNGFLVGKIGTYTITIEFIPEKYLEIGRTISLITFLAICCGLFYLTKIN